ncbi:MAG: hypothetical protein WC748_07370 [Legionellales bacterium]|jgi:hypothetical protein
MESYGEKLNRITQEFTMFAAFAALEGRFRALNTNTGTEDDVDDIAYGFATAGLAVCSVRLLYSLSGFGYIVYKDCLNYFQGNQNNYAPVVQQDPFVQLEEGLQGAQNTYRIKVDRINELETELAAERIELQTRTDNLTQRIEGLEQENAVLKKASNVQSNLNINLSK